MSCAGEQARPVRDGMQDALQCACDWTARFSDALPPSGALWRSPGAHPFRTRFSLLFLACVSPRVSAAGVANVTHRAARGGGAEGQGKLRDQVLSGRCRRSDLLSVRPPQSRMRGGRSAGSCQRMYSATPRPRPPHRRVPRFIQPSGSCEKHLQGVKQWR
jgi:hypothetical protein